jgi:hypothetical protein
MNAGGSSHPALRGGTFQVSVDSEQVLEIQERCPR